MKGEPESIAERILRLQIEEEVDPVARLLVEVRAEAKATRELLEESRKRGSGGAGGGLGNGRFAIFRDIVTLILIPLAFALGLLVLNNAERIARLEAQSVTMEQLNALEARARTERLETIGVLRDQLERHEDRDRAK